MVQYVYEGHFFLRGSRQRAAKVQGYLAHKKWPTSLIRNSLLRRQLIIKRMRVSPLLARCQGTGVPEGSQFNYQMVD